MVGHDNVFFSKSWNMLPWQEEATVSPTDPYNVSNQQWKDNGTWTWVIEL